MTIDAEQADWIVVYVDQAHAARIHADDRVRVRRRGREAMVADAQVMEIGTQYQLMPEQLRRNATIAQYGLPIKVAVPDGLPLLPGELVDVVLTEASGSPLSL